ncbi:MAG: hypothetical protein IT170_12545 [Bryobacterales bacterium]|nr:hypothetical protein [Bryobacterales bacterium]
MASPLRKAAASLQSVRVPRIAGIPGPAATVLLATLLFTQLLPLTGGPNARSLSMSDFRRVFDVLEGREFDFGTDVADPLSPLASLLARERKFPLIDPSGSLDRFFAVLQRAESGQLKKQIHILHYGDSPTTADLITADVRERMQARFGNGGYGFNLIAPPWGWYQHRGIRIRASGWNAVSPTLGMKGDGKYGLGGVSFDGHAGAYSEVTLQDHSQTHVRIYFQKQPGGGSFAIAADGQVIAETNTAAEQSASAAENYAIPPGARTVSLRVRSGDVRVYGMEFSRSRPGIIYSSLGLNGANTTTLSRSMEAAHWSQQLREADPQLVVINYGTNESVYGAFVTKYLETELRRLIERVRNAVPNSAILVMSPMDRGIRGESGEIVTPETIPDIVRIQEKVAADMKVAFFNTYEAMGGAGTMAKWYKRTPRLVGGDYIHPMPAGAKLVGDLLFEGLNEQYQRYKLKEIQKSLAAKPAVTPGPAGRRKRV